MAGFEYRGQLNGADNPVTLHVLIANSQTVKVGDAVRMQAFASAGGCYRAAATTKIFGIVVGIVNKKGIDLDNADPATFSDCTWVTGTKTVTVGSDNVTDQAVRALVVVDKWAVWYNDSAGTLAAADEFLFFDLADQDQVADQDGADNAGAVILIKRDPDNDGDASKGLFVIAESDLDSYAQQ